jgi:hypothetical protein
MNWIGEKFKPLWQYKYSFTNSAIINDFDGNGKNEIGIATYDSTRFFEITSQIGKPEIPIVYDSYSMNETEAKIKWHPIQGAQKYKIYQLVKESGGGYSVKFVKEESNDSTIISNLNPDTYSYFLISSFDETKTTQESDFSELQSIFTHKQVIPEKVEAISRKIIKIHFSGKLKPYLEDLTIIGLTAEDGSVIYNPSSIQAISDTIYILNFNNYLPNGKSFITINSFRDYWNSPTKRNVLQVDVNDEENNQELFLASLEVLSTSELRLKFSEEVLKNEAANPNNYLLSPFGRIISANSVDESTYQLILDNEISKRNITGALYSVTAKNINSKSGNKITEGSGNTLSFVLTKESLSEVIVFPNPFSISKDEILKFGNLSRDVEIEILDLNGKILKTISDKSADGGAAWDLIDDFGKKLGTGIYLYKISGKNTLNEELTPEMKKFVILP